MYLGSHPQTVPSGLYSKSSDSLERDGKRLCLFKLQFYAFSYIKCWTFFFFGGLSVKQILYLLPLVWNKFRPWVEDLKIPYWKTILYEYIIKHTMPKKRINTKQQDVLFCIFFWLARLCWPLLGLCRPFCIFER
jgi:hypothetical protein